MPGKASHVVVGAHVKGGIKGAVATALAIEAEAMQIFIGSPQSWKSPNPSGEDVKSFLSGVKSNRLGPVFVHASYLVNLASGSKENLTKSVENLSLGLQLSDAVGAQGLIFHPGSGGKSTYKEALARFLHSLDAVLGDYSGRCKLLMEVCAGQGETLGAKFSQFKDILSAFKYDKRLGVCWDTCHLFNAGYDIASSKGLKATIDEFEREVGFEWLHCIHANDSKNPLGARKDRHENIGQGYIGQEGFQRMLQHPKLRKYPWILETPGFDDKGPDRKNVEILRRLSA
jgi:deoxyribonuclease IV